MVKPRLHLGDILIKDEGENNDITLATIDEELFVGDRLYYAGKISSTLFAPLVDTVLGPYELDIYANDIYLYAFDSVLQIPDCIYMAISKSNAYKMIEGQTIYSILNAVSFRYYYDDDNIIFVFKVPEKYVEDYRKILVSDYSAVSQWYKKLCSPTGMAYAILSNNSLLKDQWQRAEALLGEVIEKRNDLDKVVKPVKIVTGTRNFPMFLFQNETYQSCVSDKSSLLQ